MSLIISPFNIGSAIRSLPIERSSTVDGRSTRFREVPVRSEPNPDALLTATQLTNWFKVISVPLIGMWRRKGHLEVKGYAGRSPLYRYGDVVEVERRMARAAWRANNHRARRVS